MWGDVVLGWGVGCLVKLGFDRWISIIVVDSIVIVVFSRLRVCEEGFDLWDEEVVKL